MLKPVTIIAFIILFFSCAANKKVQRAPEMPACLAAKIKSMASDPNQGSPVSVTRYTYRQRTVYYMVSACCDKFNVVYDSVCNILGHPDGGFTGRGDGKMQGFREEATNGKVIWKIDTPQ
jgi:hypothetical protein